MNWRIQELRIEEFEPVKKWWKNRKSNGNAWKVSIKEIQERNHNLDFKNPNKKEDLSHKSPEELVGEIGKKEQKISDLLREIKQQV